jgi:hypothetical protein
MFAAQRTVGKHSSAAKDSMSREAMRHRKGEDSSECSGWISVTPNTACGCPVNAAARQWREQLAAAAMSASERKSKMHWRKSSGQQAAVMLQTEDEAATEEEAPLEDM